MHATLRRTPEKGKYILGQRGLLEVRINMSLLASHYKSGRQDHVEFGERYVTTPSTRVKKAAAKATNV